MLINLKPIIIVSKYGKRTRNGEEEFHPGIDIRVVDKKWVQYPILAPEKMVIRKVIFDKKWGHAIFAVTGEDNELGIEEFRFLHIKPNGDCVEGAPFDEGAEIGMPESGFVDLHLHFECRVRGNPIDPEKYLKMRDIEYEVLKKG